MLVKNFSHSHLLGSVIKLPEGLSVKPGRLEHRLKQDMGYIQSLSANPEGSLLAVASNDLVFLFDVSKETEIMRYKVLSGEVTSVNLCRSGRFLALGTSGGDTILYDLDVKRSIKIHNHPLGNKLRLHQR